MVTGWRKAFCTTIPKDKVPEKVFTEKGIKQHHCHNNNTTTTTTHQSPKTSSKFAFFSNPSTPSLRCRTSVATAATPTSSVPNTPKLQCSIPKKQKSPSSFFHLSNPSSPKSPSSFSILKSGLRLSKSRCGICMQSAKAGQGTAIFTAECSHSFHFHCIAAHVKTQQYLICPVCSAKWKELPLLSIKRSSEDDRAQKIVKVYSDDEPLVSPTSVSRFNPIPESEEESQDESIEFQGFNVNPLFSPRHRNIEMCLLPEAAIMAANRSHETYAVVLKIKAPPSPTAACRAPTDLVTVLDVGGTMHGAKLRMMKKSMRLVISSLGPTDRLSIVAFSSSSRRLLPLRRMTRSGQRSAMRIVDALAAIDQFRDGVSVKNEAVKKAAKVMEDRREKNPVGSIILLSEVLQCERVTAPSFIQKRSLLSVSSTRFPQLEIPVHSVGFPDHAPPDDAFAKCVVGLLNLVVQDLRIQLEVTSRKLPVEIAAVYPRSGRPGSFGSTLVRLGDLYGEEERELLVELKVPAASAESHHVLSVRPFYRDPSTQRLIQSQEQAFLIPKIQRLQNLHVTTQAVAESRRLAEHHNLVGAHHLLMKSAQKSAGEFLQWRRSNSMEEKLEPLTPTSAWRAAEKLAKLAMMRKSMKRVSDLHGFENARF